MKSLVLATSLLVASTLASSAMAATVQTNDFGEMIGISGVNVSGYGMYDVSFDSYPTDLEKRLYSTEFAVNATEALLGLFTTGSLSGTEYDVNPLDIYGVQAINTFDGSTYDFNGYFLIYNSFVFVNDLSYNDSGDYIMTVNSFAEYIDYNPMEYAATWTAAPSVSAVPVPAAAFMFAPALVGFMGLRRKAKTV